MNTAADVEWVLPVTKLHKKLSRKYVLPSLIDSASPLYRSSLLSCETVMELMLVRIQSGVPRSKTGMIYLRLGQTTAPIPLKCSFCPYVSPAGETFFFQEAEVILSDMRHDREFETMCPMCYTRIKDAAIKHKIPVEFDYEIPKQEGVRLTTTTKTREF